MTGSTDVEPDAPAARESWGRWFGRPGRSLTRRLIWLASAWIVIALVVTGLVLTSLFQESGLRRLGNTLSDTIDEVVVASNVSGDTVVTSEIKDARSLRPLSGKYWAVAEPTADGRLRMLVRSELAGGG